MMEMSFRCEIFEHFSPCAVATVLRIGVYFERCTQSSVQWAIWNLNGISYPAFDCSVASAHLTVIREHMWVLMVTARKSSYYCYCQAGSVASTSQASRLHCWCTRHTHTHTTTLKCNFNLFGRCRTILLICSWYAWYCVLESLCVRVSLESTANAREEQSLSGECARAYCATIISNRLML